MGAPTKNPFEMRIEQEMKYTGRRYVSVVIELFQQK